MSATLTTQTHLYAYSGTANWEDGSGMHTWIARDMVPAVNNLGAYVDLRSALVACPRTSWVSGESPKGAVERLVHTASREIYMEQVPVVIPPNAKRMVWTIDVEGRDASGSGMQITQVKLYLSGSPYLGTVPTAAPAFDSTLLSPDYLSRAVSLTISTSTTQHQLAVDATTGITPCAAPSFPRSTAEIHAHAVVTVTAVGGAQRYARLYGLTYWFLYE